MATWILYRSEHKTLKEIGLNLQLRNISFILPGLFLGYLLFGGLLFAFYHDIWGNPIVLPFTILSFLLSHYVFSASLLKSANLYFPICIHLGHWSSQYFTGYKISDKGMFYITNQQNFNSWQAFLIFWVTYNLGFIVLAGLFWKFRHREVLLLRKLSDSKLS